MSEWGYRVLTDLKCRKAKAQEKAYKLADAQGLFLYVSKTGHKSWRWKYRIHGKEKLLTFGSYPEVSLLEAREARDEAAKLRRSGMDPRTAQKQAKASSAFAALDTFEAVARSWLKQRSAVLSERQSNAIIRSLENDIFPTIGSLQIQDVTAPLILQALEPVEERGAYDQAQRMQQRISAIFNLAIARGLVTQNPAIPLRTALTRPVFGRRPAAETIEEAREVLNAVEALPAHPIVKLANRFLALTAVRSFPLRFAELREFENLESEAIWRIPSVKMKMTTEQRERAPQEFIVPLPKQAIEILRVAKQFSAGSNLAFPSIRHAHKPMSDNTLSAMYRRTPATVGKHVPHGWRSTFSTVMNARAEELGNPGDRAVIDLMLAHKPQGVESIYNRFAYMDRRRRIAEDWADMLTQGIMPAEDLLKGPRN